MGAGSCPLVWGLGGGVGREVTLPAWNSHTSRGHFSHFLRTRDTLPGLDLHQSRSENVTKNQAREVCPWFAGSVKYDPGKCENSKREV